jgi:hypothetical protein
MLINWTSLIVVCFLGILGLWIAYSFLNKGGLFLFSILAIVLSATMTPALVYSSVSMGIVLMPIIFLAMLITYHKYGKDDAKRLFYVSLATIGVLFVFFFFEAAYLDSELGGQYYLTWANLGTLISMAVAYSGAVCVGYFATTKMSFKIKDEFMRRGTMVSFASIIYCLLFVVLANISQLSFGSILLLFFISVLIAVAVSFIVSYLSKFLNRKPIITIAPENAGEDKQMRKEEPTQETEEKAKDDNKEEK